jgi:DNA-binding CsgD family transcriptional regulator
VASLRSPNVASRLFGLNEQLDEVGDVGYFAAAASLLADVIPGDLVAWNDVNVTDSSATVLGREGARLNQQPPDLAERVARTGLDHPAIRSYFVDPKDTSPRRLSDLVGAAEFRRTRTYTELFRPMGAAAQLTILTKRDLNEAGGGWAINRSIGDFSDREVELARALQPSLILLERAYTRSPTRHPARTEQITYRLTPRETRVLKLLAEGLTAVSIGHVLCISPRTARKHLENIYSKLGTHDRLMAVTIALKHDLIRAP